MNVVHFEPDQEFQRRIRMLGTSLPAPENRNAGQKFHGWMIGAYETALKCAHKGDKFGAALAMSRCDIYGRYAEMARTDATDAEIAEAIERVLKQRSFEKPSLAPGYDFTAIQYAAGRALQLCLSTIAPDAPIYVKKMDD